MGKKKQSRSSTKKSQAKKSVPVTATSSRKDVMNQIKPPEPFNFQEPSSWTAWIKRFKMFQSAFGLSADAEEEQISMLLYCMGLEADALLISLGMTEEKRKSFDSVVNKFEEHFIKNNNLFHHRLLFFERDQKPGEKIDSYFNSLNELSEKCEWSCKNCKSMFKDELVLLKLITGVSNSNLCKRLKDQGVMTLNMGVETIRLMEILEETGINLLDDSNKQTSSAVKRENTREPGNQQGNPTTSSKISNATLHIPNQHDKCESPVHFRQKPIYQEEKGSMRYSFSSGVDTGDESYQQGDPTSSKKSNSNVPLHSPNQHEKFLSSVHQVRKPIFPLEEKGKMRLSFSSGVDTGDECELPANRFCDKTGQRPTRDNYWGVHSERTPSASTSCKDKKLPPKNFLEEKNCIDFPSLPQPSEEEGVWEYPRDKKTAGLYSKKMLILQDQLNYKMGLYDLDDPSDEDEFFEREYIKYLRETNMDLYLDYVYYNAYSVEETTPKVEKSPKVEEIPNEPKHCGNYHFSVSGHQSRKSLRNQCQQKLKDFKKYRY